MSLPVTRPAGPALVVGNAACRAQPAAVLERMGFTPVGADDPYAAMAELARSPAAYRALILSLQGVYREELKLIPVAKRRFPQLEIWLADTDGRQASLAEAMTLGADGLISEEGLHRMAAPRPESVATTAIPLQPPERKNGEHKSAAPPAERPQPAANSSGIKSGKKRRHRPAVVVEESADEYGLGEAILTAEELRALLQEPSVPAQDVKQS